MVAWGREPVSIGNDYSVVSTGTEGSTVQPIGKSLIGKARERARWASRSGWLLSSASPVSACMMPPTLLNILREAGLEARTCGPLESDIEDIERIEQMGRTEHAVIIEGPKP